MSISPGLRILTEVQKTPIMAKLSNYTNLLILRAAESSKFADIEKTEVITETTEFAVIAEVAEIAEIADITHIAAIVEIADIAEIATTVDVA